MTQLYKAASYYRDKGLSVLPCKLYFQETKGGKLKCKKPPIIKEWLPLQKKQVDTITFRSWKNMFPDEKGRGIGIITGEVSNLLVVDVDSEESHKDFLPFIDGVKTVVVKTPGGWHYYFKHRDGFENNVAIDESAGLDIRTNGGYVIAPPSLYPDGQPYEYIKGCKFTGQQDVAPMPEGLYQHMLKLVITKKGDRGKAKTRKKAGAWFHDMLLNGITEGERTKKMVEAEGYMIGRNVPRDLIESVMLLFNKSIPDPLTDKEMNEEVIPAIDRITGDIVEQTVNRLNKKLSLVELASGERVISEIFKDFKGRKQLRFATVGQVRESYINKEIMVNKKPECIFDIWRYSKLKRKHQGVIFDPSENPWEVDDFINLWKGFLIKPKKGNWSKFRWHIENVISKEHHEWILQWMARIVQDPGGDRPGTAIVMRGGLGTGKGIFANTFGALLGKMEYYFSVNKISDLTGKFNEDLKTALLLFIDEATWGGDKETAGVLKSLITEPTRRIEPKGINAFHVDNYLNLIIASNNKWVVPGGANERRFFVLDIPNDKIQNKPYFNAIVKQMYKDGGLEAMYYDLLHMDYDFDTIATIPQTEATGDQIRMSLDIDEEFWLERLTAGTIVDAHTFWKHAVAFEKLYAQYEHFCDSRGVKRGKSGRQLFGTFLKRVCPKSGKTRPRVGHDRFRCQTFPHLEECRSAFAKIYGLQNDWPDINERDNITKEERNTDKPGSFMRLDSPYV